MENSAYSLVPTNESLLLYAILFQIRPLGFEVSGDVRPAVVTRITNPEHRESGLRIGSIITEINEQYVEQMRVSQIIKILNTSELPLKILFKQQLFDITIRSKFPIGFIVDGDVNGNDAIVTNVYDTNLSAMGLKIGQYIYKIGFNTYCDGLSHNKIVKFIAKQQTPFTITFRKFNVDLTSIESGGKEDELKLQSLVGGTVHNFLSLKSVFDSWRRIKKMKDTSFVERIAFILSYYARWIDAYDPNDDVYGISLSQLFDELDGYNIVDLLNDYKCLMDAYSDHTSRAELLLYLSYKLGAVRNNAECVMFQRNNRDRSKALNYNETYLVSAAELDCDLDIDSICIAQHLDKMYSYLVCCAGFELNAEVAEYRSALIAVGGMTPERMSKYQTKVNMHLALELEEKEEYKMYNGYQFGSRFHYWNYYKTFHEDWSYFVEAKHGCLKEEMLNNILNICMTQWHIVCRKASQVSSMTHCREILKARKGFACDYEIEYESCMDLNHVIALLFYCNFDVLRDALTRSYFYNIKQEDSSNESYDALKERHSVYANFGKLLVECVHAFGDEMSRKQQYLHCIDGEVLFSLFCAEFHAPTFMTSALSIADLYCDDGFILILGSDDRARNFDCGWISDDSHEAPRLFIGGQYLEIRSIIHVISKENYQFYMDAMKVFQSLMSGEYIVHKISNSIMEILVAMINNELNIGNKNVKQRVSAAAVVPPYIEKLFHNYCKNIVREITLRMCYLSLKYISASLRKYFVAHNDQMLKLEILFDLFPSIQKLRVTYEQNHGLILNQNSYEYFLHFIATNKIPHQFNQLLIRPNDRKSISIQSMIHKYAKEFSKYGVQITKETNVFGDDYVSFVKLQTNHINNNYRYCVLL